MIQNQAEIGQRPIHFEHAHLCAIPERSPFESKTWQWRRGKIQVIMTTIGKIESFDDTKENWETYVERVEQFFLANDIDDDHKVPTLLSLIGGKTYTLLRDLLAPEKPATKSFQQIVTTLQEHLSPKPLEIAERFRFYKKNQHEGESILSYVAELRKLATHCNFGGNLNEALRDRLVCGLRNMQIQKRLLSEAKLKYSKAVEIAVAMETAIRDASELLSELNPTQSLTLTNWLNTTNQHQRNRRPPSFATAVVGTHIRHTTVFTRNRSATTVENKAISSEVVVPNSKASLSKQPKPQRYMLLRLMLMLMHMKTY